MAENGKKQDVNLNFAFIPRLMIVLIIRLGLLACCDKLHR